MNQLELRQIFRKIALKQGMLLDCGQNEPESKGYWWLPAC